MGIVKLILENLLPILAAIVTPVLLVLAHRLIAAAAKKWHLEGVLVYDDKVDSLIETGVMATEKAALNALKNDKPATPSEEKLKGVIDFVNSQLDQHGLPQKAGDALAKLVDAKLMQIDQSTPSTSTAGMAVPPPLPPAPAASTPTVAVGK